MKRVLFLAALMCGVVYAGVPQPCIVVHGLVRDAYGYPYIEGAHVVVSRGETQCVDYAIVGLLRGGENYAVALDVDSGGTRYAEYAVQSGDQLDVSVSVAGQAQPLIGTPTITVAEPGVEQRLDIWVGEDLDNDGLPDAWELEVIAQSDGILTDLESVRPEDDFDGDGLTNLQEFMAGTFATLKTDLLQIEGVTLAEGGRLVLRFLTSPNQTYRLTATDVLEGGSWQPIPFATTQDGPIVYSDVVGDGGWQTVYVNSHSASLFLRLATL